MLESITSNLKLRMFTNRLTLNEVETALQLFMDTVMPSVVTKSPLQ